MSSDESVSPGVGDAPDQIWNGVVALMRGTFIVAATAVAVAGALGWPRRTAGALPLNMSSLSGITPIPFMRIYSASKFALDGYTEALRHEVSPFNIHVSQVEPPFLRTPMMSHRQSAARHIPEYDRWRDRAYEAVHSQEESGPGPELVAETILKIIRSKKPRLQYIVGQARRVTRLRRFLPEAAFEQGGRRPFRLDKA